MDTATGRYFFSAAWVVLLGIFKNRTFQTIEPRPYRYAVELTLIIHGISWRLYYVLWWRDVYLKWRKISVNKHHISLYTSNAHPYRETIFDSTPSYVYLLFFSHRTKKKIRLPKNLLLPHSCRVLMLYTRYIIYIYIYCNTAHAVWELGRKRAFYWKIRGVQTGYCIVHTHKWKIIKTLYKCYSKSVIVYQSIFPLSSRVLIWVVIHTIL